MTTPQPGDDAAVRTADGPVLTVTVDRRCVRNAVDAALATLAPKRAPVSAGR